VKKAAPDLDWNDESPTFNLDSRKLWRYRFLKMLCLPTLKCMSVYYYWCCLNFPHLLLPGCLYLLSRRLWDHQLCLIKYVLPNRGNDGEEC
jgi:hypothetical protein